MGRAAMVQLRDLREVSYQPLAEAFRDIEPVETHHAELALEGIGRLVRTEGAPAVQEAVSEWWPRVATSFGRPGSERFARLSAMGLRHTPNEALRAAWEEETTAILGTLGLRPG